MVTIAITQVSKLKHAGLRRAAKKMGSQAALARHLGVHQSDLGRWCNLQATPPKSWPPERLAEIEQKLFALTSETLDELFPEELKSAKEFLAASKTLEKTHDIETVALLTYAEIQSGRLSYKPPEEAASEKEYKKALASVLNTLSYREREIVKLRYGLGSGYSYSLEEVAAIFNVTKERIRQIEAKAVRKLQQPSRIAKLISFAPERTEPLPSYEPPTEVWPSEIYCEQV